MEIWWVTSLMFPDIVIHKPKEYDGSKEVNGPAPTLPVVGDPLSCQSCTTTGTAHPTSNSKLKNHRYTKAAEKIQTITEGRRALQTREKMKVLVLFLFVPV